MISSWIVIIIYLLLNKYSLVLLVVGVFHQRALVLLAEGCSQALDIYLLPAHFCLVGGNREKSEQNICAHCGVMAVHTSAYLYKM